MDGSQADDRRKCKSSSVQVLYRLHRQGYESVCTTLCSHKYVYIYIHIDTYSFKCTYACKIPIPCNRNYTKNRNPYSAQHRTQGLARGLRHARDRHRCCRRNNPSRTPRPVEAPRLPRDRRRAHPCRQVRGGEDGEHALIARRLPQLVARPGERTPTGARCQSGA